MDDLDTANTAKELMQQQWSELVKPGCRVKVTIMDKFLDAVVERTHYISKLLTTVSSLQLLLCNY